MLIAVAGATGRLGRHVVEVLEERGHGVVPISRASGRDVITGVGLEHALTGVDAIIDAATGPSPDRDAATEFFTAAARNLQEAGDAPRVRHIGSSEPTGKPAAPEGGQVQLESGYSPETIRELEHRGHPGRGFGGGIPGDGQQLHRQRLDRHLGEGGHHAQLHR